MFRLGIFLAIIGGVLGFLGFQEWRLSAGAKDKPQEISLKDLIAKGPGDNAHIVLKDFLLCENFIVESKKNSNTWSKAWNPIVPREGAPDKINLKPSSFGAILMCPAARNQGDLDRIAQNATLKGMVINEIQSLGAEEKKVLKQSYPNTDFDKCWIIEPDRQPAGMGKLVAFLGGGALLLVGGVGAMIASSRRRRE
jgi:hypothetical protein